MSFFNKNFYALFISPIVVILALFYVKDIFSLIWCILTVHCNVLIVSSVQLYTIYTYHSLTGLLLFVLAGLLLYWLVSAAVEGGALKVLVSDTLTVELVFVLILRTMMTIRTSATMTTTMIPTTRKVPDILMRPWWTFDSMFTCVSGSVFAGFS